MTNYFYKYYYFVLICIFLFNPQIAIGQISTIDSLRTSISRDENNLSKLKLQKENIYKIFNQINNKIYKIKLNNSDDPISRIELNKYLKVSNLYANSLDSLNSLINSSLSLLNIKYNNLITKLNGMILNEQEKFKKETNAQKKINIFETIQKLDKERQKYLDSINKSSTKMDLSIPLNIEPNDSFERIKLKIDIINDRIHYTDEERRTLLNRQNELKSELSIYQDMLDFMADLRLNIDEEQDFYDRDRVNQLHYHVREIKKELSEVEIRLKTIDVEKSRFLEKLKIFKKFLDTLLKPSNKNEK
ncbi:MAG: hypothetical protein ACYCVH_06800 [Ignavibacteriaceae bacterium]